MGVLIGPKSRGSNLEALVKAGEKVGSSFQVTSVVAPTPTSPGLVVSERYRVPSVVLEPGEAYGDRLLQALRDVQWICLAGYLRLLPSEVLNAFPGRVLNIHPSLLPKFGGKGMYGHHVHEAVLASGETETGCTVHRVTPEYDEGEILLQLRCPVNPEDTPESLAARVQELEHMAFPEALDRAVRSQS